MRFAGAAAVIVAVVWLATPTVNNPDNSIRSSELMLLAPSNSGGSTLLRWESPYNAARYRVMIRDGAGVLIYRQEVTALWVRLDEQSRARLNPRALYVWQVTALDQDGEVIAESKPATLQFTP